MLDSMQLRELRLSFVSERDLLSDFLRSHDLRLEGDEECAFGIFSDEDCLQGCGCAAGNVLKCFAIDESLRGENGLSALISRLSANRFAAGFSQLFIITRPQNRLLFSRCGFYPLMETQSVLLLENRRNGVERFLDTIPPSPASAEDVGAIVMNCNPLTNGHLALIQYAADRCDFLYLFVVEENRAAFPFADRLALVRQATAEMSNVCVCPSGAYMISAMTFPTYFLKETENPAALQSELDIRLFCRLIAPTLKIRRRFAGQEPTDAVTRAYHDAMKRLLPTFGIEFCEIPRVELDGIPISASRVRRLLASGEPAMEEALRLVPPCTAAYLQRTFPTAGNGDPR